MTAIKKAMAAAGAPFADVRLPKEPTMLRPALTFSMLLLVSPIAIARGEDSNRRPPIPPRQPSQAWRPRKPKSS